MYIRTLITLVRFLNDTRVTRGHLDQATLKDDLWSIRLLEQTGSYYGCVLCTVSYEVICRGNCHLMAFNSCALRTC